MDLKHVVGLVNGDRGGLKDAVDVPLGPGHRIQLPHEDPFGANDLPRESPSLFLCGHNQQGRR